MDLTKLKELAERMEDSDEIQRLRLDNESLKGSCKAMGKDMAKLTRERNSIKAKHDKLIAEVERLRTRLEIDERTPYDGIACRDETIKGLDEKCDRLKAENEALRKDAERYRWLRDGRNYTHSWIINLGALNLQEFDAAIDAALEGGGR